MFKKILTLLTFSAFVFAFSTRVSPVLAGETYYGQCDGISEPMLCAGKVIAEKGGPQNAHETALQDFLTRCSLPNGDPNDFYTWNCQDSSGVYPSETYYEQSGYGPYDYGYSDQLATPRTYDQVRIEESEAKDQKESWYQPVINLFVSFF